MLSTLFLAVLLADERTLSIPGLPDPNGFAGMFAAANGREVIAAGGANFPEKKPWDGGTKVWADSVFVLEKSADRWRKLAHGLPRKLGYGVACAWDGGLVCAGGSDADRHYADCFLLKYVDAKITVIKFPNLPKPCANACGARVGDVLYLAGGQDTPTSEALKTLWALDLRRTDLGWKELPAWPGPARILAVAATNGKSFYMFSGAELQANKDGKLSRKYLNDAYAFTPGVGWKKLASLPRPAVAAPSPAPFVSGQMLVASGDDGTKVDFEPRSKHPGFSADILSYNPDRDSWSTVRDSTLSRVTAPVVFWQRVPIMVSGETSPGIRTPSVDRLDQKQR